MPTPAQIEHRRAADRLAVSLAALASYTNTPASWPETVERPHITAARVARLCAVEVKAADQIEARRMLETAARSVATALQPVPHESGRAAAVVCLRQLHGRLQQCGATGSADVAQRALDAMRSLWGGRRGPVADLLDAPVSL